MATMFAGPFFPPGYDLGFDFDSSLDEDTPWLPYDFGQGMTQTYPVLQDQVSFLSPQSPASLRSDVAKASPGRDTCQAPAASQGSASLSPAEIIYTPTSTLLEYDESNVLDDAAYQNASTSPESNTFSADDFVRVNGPEDEMSSGSASMISQSPHPSRAISSSQLALASPQRQSASSADQTSQHPHWHRLSSSPMNTSMEDSFVPYTSSADLDLPAVPWMEDDLLSQTSAFNATFASQAYATSFRTLSHGSFQQLPDASNGLSFEPQQPVAIETQAGVLYPSVNAGTGLIPDPTGVCAPQQQVASSFHQHSFAHQNTTQAHVPSGSFPQQQRQQYVVRSQAPGISQSRQSNVAALVANSLATPAPTNHPMQTHQQHQQQYGMLDDSPSTQLSSLRSRRGRAADLLPFASSATATQTSRRLARRDLAQSSHGPVPPPQTDRTKRGGRQKNMHLSNETRQQSHAMRKRGACWRCAMQRDQCDPGEPCKRCINRESKGGSILHFGCDRSKLPDFIHDFLPRQASMTGPHQKQMIEDSVKSQVRHWDKENARDLYLTVFYGEPLAWKCYEFVPRTPEFTTQYQFFRDETTGQQVRKIKYSPPFGLLKIDSSDDHHFEAYLDRLMQPKYLWEFAWCFYEEECLVEPNEFQAHLLDDMCILYGDTADKGLHDLLKDIIRMLLLTHIMGRTLCIVEQNLPTVISSVRHTKTPAECLPFTSPKMANRQLKFFFGLLRTQIYEKILKWQQQTFHIGGKKETTWTQSFCVMLGFAMVLEEVQRLMHIQAETSAEQGLMSWDDASRQAENAFDRIDGRYKLLIGLFQCKYRDKTWGENGSFGPHTPRLTEPAQVHFLRKVRYLLVKDQNHLRSRENVSFGRDTQCLYTTRQTARFLLPFLTLQGS
ncbi:hypothetical protein DOTSEDRAFT_75105 [Dothistroma septosporum NZE10]|uniref:Zn(2)-C6 fungal-type domain-containing protein n=1 Tax=Dothistroma septosporum (strain NZE10 / CBS 128990) TaxID=675120 RepID=M2WJY7_DOTSN|nr:hypothetical protein DOTSEDRAFT_75105 [Dothistroma septosporum NZE10]